MNPNNEVDRRRLFKAMEWSFRALEPFRNLVHGLVQEYAGSSYGQSGTTRPKYEILINLMNQTVDTYTMSLVANRPRVSVIPRRNTPKYFAKRFEVALNNLIAEIRLEQTLRRAVMDAFFCMGIVKMHLKDSPQVQIEGDITINPAMPFVSNVSIDNWVQDMAAPNTESFQYAGEWYRIPYEDRNQDIFDQATIKQLDIKPSSKWCFKDQEGRLDQIITGTQTDPDELEPMVDLCDVWIPRDGMIYTFPINPLTPFSGGAKAIAGIPWDNPQYGPYPIRSFKDVPSNTVPASQAAHLSGMARIINNIARKQARKAQNQKEVITYTPSGAQDAERVVKASDQQSIAVQDQSEVKVTKLGGVDQPLQAYMLGMLQLHDRMAGNLSAMAGLGSQAPTLGQEEMIQGAVSKKEAAMQYRVTDFTVSIIRNLGYMLWNDQSTTIPGSITYPGLEDYEPTDATWTPAEREGGFSDYDVDIDVYSMPYQSPARKFQTMLDLVQGVFVPASAALAQQGGQVNYRKIAEKAAELLNEPDFTEIIQFNAAPPIDQTGMEPPGMPANTSREYIRRSVSTGGTPQARSTVEQQAWLGQADNSAGQQGN
jgi:hypothetical protein